MDARFPGFYKDGLRLYLEHKVPPSHSLNAILTSNLFEAAARCDSRNWEHIKNWVSMIHNKFPTSIYGDKETVRKWLTNERYDTWVDYYVPRVKAFETDITVEGMEEASAV